MSYDAERRLISVTDPLGKTTRNYTRDALGRISAFTNGRGQTVSYEYDDDGSIIRKKCQGNIVANHSYTTNGYLSSVIDDWGTTSMSYDAAGRVTQIDYPTGKALAVVYDDGGNIVSLSYPGGLTATYTYDSLNRTTRVDFGGESISFAYDAVWNLTGETRSNGVNSTYTFDANHRLTGVKATKGGYTIVKVAYTRDKDGRITNESGEKPLAPDPQTTSVSATYNAADEVTAWGSDAYTYDNDGNLTAISGSRSLTATYDPENRPASLTLGGTARTYVYDGLGRRVRIQAGGNTRNLHHDHLGRLLFETNDTGQLNAIYIYAGGLLVAQGDGLGSYAFPLRDKTGSTLALTDENGSVTAVYAYGPYGASACKNGGSTIPFTFVGAFGVMDEGDDLYFMKHRYYEAVTGRFIQKDPIGFKGGQTNLYAYVGNNPTDRIDPEGQKVRIGAGDQTMLAIFYNLSDCDVSEFYHLALPRQTKADLEEQDPVEAYLRELPGIQWVYDEDLTCRSRKSDDESIEIYKRYYRNLPRDPEVQKFKYTVKKYLELLDYKESQDEKDRSETYSKEHCKEHPFDCF